MVYLSLYESAWLYVHTLKDKNFTGSRRLASANIIKNSEIKGL